MKIDKPLRALKSSMIFSCVIVFQYGITYFVQSFLKIDELINDFYIENLMHEHLEEMISERRKWWFVGYAMIPLFVFIRSSLVALCLSIIAFFYDMEHPFKFKQFLRITLIGEFVWVLVGIAKFAYFYWFQTEFILVDFQQYYPLSFTNYLDLETLDPWFVYPLQTINLFEVLYFFVLVYGMHKLLKGSYWASFEKVAVGYGTGLLVWLGLTMFLILNMS
jgi:hypothetical protein